MSSRRFRTLQATPPRRTSKPAPLGKSTLSPGSIPCASVPTAVTMPVRLSASVLWGMISPVLRLDVLVQRLDDQVVVERLERDRERGGIFHLLGL